MTVSVDLDFQRYIERKKGARDAQMREGAAYAYGGDVRYRSTLDSIRPVRMAVEAAVRLWQSSARTELLAQAQRVSPDHHAKLDAVVERAARVLHIERPEVYLSAAPLAAPGIHTLGTDEDACILLDGSVVERADERQLLFSLGRECGHLQNGHVVYSTAVYYLANEANRFLKWIIAPASLALSAWGRRAEVTCDRAGLICARDLDTAERLLVRLAAEQPVDGDFVAFLEQLHAARGDEAATDTYGKLLAERLPHARAIAQRVEALYLFTRSTYYKALVGESGGLTQAEVDGQVGEVLGR